MEGFNVGMEVVEEEEEEEEVKGKLEWKRILEEKEDVGMEE